MTEAEWLACTNPAPLLDCLRLSRKASGRKLRLFAVACCRSDWTWTRLEDQRSRRAVEVAERLADDQVGKEELGPAAHEAYEAAVDASAQRVDNWVWLSECAWRAAHSIDPDPFTFVDKQFLRESVRGEGTKSEATLVREIFGNPFRPVSLDSGWLTPTVKQIAESIYNDRAFEKMPILGDALEDAGCGNADILNHCRQPGEHVRGCWVLDLVLGKE